MNTERASAIFDRNQIKEWICRVEDDAAHFIGAEFCAARLIGFVSKQRELGEVDDKTATQLLSDARHLDNLAQLGHLYVKLVRKPSAELRIMVLSDEKRMQ
jgi:hypothetical protein